MASLNPSAICGAGLDRRAERRAGRWSPSAHSSIVAPKAAARSSSVRANASLSAFAASARSRWASADSISLAQRVTHRRERAVGPPARLADSFPGPRRDRRPLASRARFPEAIQPRRRSPAECCAEQPEPCDPDDQKGGSGRSSRRARTPQRRGTWTATDQSSDTGARTRRVVDPVDEAERRRRDRADRILLGEQGRPDTAVVPLTGDALAVAGGDRPVRLHDRRERARGRLPEVRDDRRERLP